MNGSILPSLSEFGLKAVTASEIEFYLFGSHDIDLIPFWDEVKILCAENGIPLFNVEKERGREQHEVSLMPCAPEKTARDTELLKNIIFKTAIKHDIRPDFSAKPVADDFGSGLHIHVHLENDAEKNQFFKNDEMISVTLAHSLSGLMLWLPDCMPVFAPNEDSYKRFVPGSNSPLTVSWGANNRTVAIRLPDSDRDNKRIEHRVAGADADVAKVIEVIIAAMHHGLSVKALPGKQMYGDARLANYELPRFAENLAVAKERMRASELPFKKYGILIDC